MFKVLESGKPAVLPDSEYDIWKNNEFKTFQEAVDYANYWLGDYGPLNEGYNVGAKFYFYGLECWMEIVEE